MTDRTILLTVRDGHMVASGFVSGPRPACRAKPLNVKDERQVWPEIQRLNRLGLQDEAEKLLEQHCAS